MKNNNCTTNDSSEFGNANIGQQPGILLESVGSFLDSKGIHPLYDTGLPDLHKDMTVSYKEVEVFEFLQLMSDKDKVLYKVAIQEYAPTLKSTNAWRNAAP
jgi:hypothetical protein